VIRRLTVEDQAEVLRLNELIQKSDKPPGFTWGEFEIADELRKGKAVGFVESGKLIGFVLYRYLEPHLEILLLGTDPSFGRRAVMTQLVEWLKTSEVGLQEIWLEVHEMNLKACNFYEKIGFASKGLRPKYYRDGGAARVMSLVVSPTEG
jgi:[ribosomal protein S18]-alanine N-acetyltransferase